MSHKREFLLLADDYVPAKHDVGGWWMSEKLDGHRALWDGGASRGILASDVPYANVAKDARYKVPPVATGLWSRYGKVIRAPDAWLDGLPRGVVLDGELYLGRGKFQELGSIVKTLEPDVDAWKKVMLQAIDAPSFEALFQFGELTGANWKGWLEPDMALWAHAQLWGKVCPLHPAQWSGYGLPDECFSQLVALHQAACALGHTSWRPMQQEKLPRDIGEAREMVEARLQHVTSLKGEGLMLRAPHGAWLPKRVPWLLKVKRLQDAEGTVTGFTWGRITALGSRHLGRMGALVLDYGGKRLELSGFTDVERAVMPTEDGVSYAQHGDTFVGEEAIRNEGKDASRAWAPMHFPIGTRVTFTYRELSDDGIPKEARYLRRREEP